MGPLYGDTDSERYFALLRYHIQEAPDALTGIHKTIAWISENRDYTSLNFLLADGNRLYALRSVGNEDLWVRRLEAGEDLLGPSSYGTRRRPVSAGEPRSSPPKNWITPLLGKSWSRVPWPSSIATSAAGAAPPLVLSPVPKNAEPSDRAGPSAIIAALRPRRGSSRCWRVSTDRGTGRAAQARMRLRR